MYTFGHFENTFWEFYYFLFYENICAQIVIIFAHLRLNSLKHWNTFGKLIRMRHIFTLFGTLCHTFDTCAQLDTNSKFVNTISRIFSSEKSKSVHCGCHRETRHGTEKDFDCPNLRWEKQEQNGFYCFFCLLW